MPIWYVQVLKGATTAIRIGLLCSGLGVDVCLSDHLSPFLLLLLPFLAAAFSMVWAALLKGLLCLCGETSHPSSLLKIPTLGSQSAQEYTKVREDTSQNLDLCTLSKWLAPFSQPLASQALSTSIFQLHWHLQGHEEKAWHCSSFELPLPICSALTELVGRWKGYFWWEGLAIFPKQKQSLLQDSEYYKTLLI